MDTISLLLTISLHKAFNHPIFEMMLKKKPTHEQLRKYLWYMGKFCETSRSARNMVSSLRQLGLEKQAKLIEEIDESEKGHGPQFDMMSTRLLDRPLNGVFKPEHALSRMESIFDRRRNKNRFFVEFSLGVYAGVEIMANRHIIPGEMAIFIKSGHYDVTLDEPAMAYLREHAGDSGAEASHERRILEVLKDLPVTAEKNVIMGTAHFMDGLNQFYDMLVSFL